ncbi:hypothetical protein HYH03_017439 [Edaphochlamys debaryana]|uniref:Uncharacterized protein n=1 Tax=Edaphochlamys debaryana TaxID=47281 RepID=A0A835XH89_9CHLO|nr:hypothetical protein HYH03_017439 [Edaphochlamys debaryana]|eukprot:KAG2483721.1 hypothetical protein HYH03_017439 [Edaphochlamys debaryana]
MVASSALPGLPLSSSRAPAPCVQQQELLMMLPLRALAAASAQSGTGIAAGHPSPRHHGPARPHPSVSVSTSASACGSSCQSSTCGADSGPSPSPKSVATSETSSAGGREASHDGGPSLGLGLGLAGAPAPLSSRVSSTPRRHSLGYAPMPPPAAYSAMTAGCPALPPVAMSPRVVAAGGSRSCSGDCTPSPRPHGPGGCGTRGYGALPAGAAARDPGPNLSLPGAAGAGAGGGEPRLVHTRSQPHLNVTPPPPPQQQRPGLLLPSPRRGSGAEHTTLSVQAPAQSAAPLPSLSPPGRVGSGNSVGAGTEAGGPGPVGPARLPEPMLRLPSLGSGAVATPCAAERKGGGWSSRTYGAEVPLAGRVAS